MIGASPLAPDDLKKLLEAALALLSEYAARLNQMDGGDRKTFQSIDQWKIHVGTK